MNLKLDMNRLRIRLSPADNEVLLRAGWVEHGFVLPGIGAWRVGVRLAELHSSFLECRTESSRDGSPVVTLLVDRTRWLGTPDAPGWSEGELECEWIDSRNGHGRTPGDLDRGVGDFRIVLEVDRFKKRRNSDGLASKNIC